MGNGQVNRKKKAKKEEKSFRRDFYRQAFRKRKRIRILGPPDASRIEFTVTAVAEKKNKKTNKGPASRRLISLIAQFPFGSALASITVFHQSLSALSDPINQK